MDETGLRADDRSERAITIDDVARQAGVSTATVTRALQGHPHVRPETRARVEGAALALGYVPHLGARALAMRSSRTIGLLVPSSADGFWGEVAEGLEDRAALDGFSTLLATSHADPARERSLITLFVGKRVDGIVIGSAAGSSWRGLPSAASRLVLVNWEAPLGHALLEAARCDPVEQVVAAVEARTSEAVPLAHVRTDDVAGAADATRHLIALGHRRIAFVGLRPVRPALLRLLGVRSALADVGLRPSHVVDAAAALEDGRRAGDAILAAPDRPTAVVAFDDMTAVGIVRAAHAAGLAVPRDLSVVGFDDVAVAAFVEPPLTTVRQHKAALGGLAVEVILGAIAGAPVPAPPILRGSLVVRESTAPPPA